MTDDRVKSRAEEAPPEEQGSGTDDPEQQAEAIISESDERQADRNAAPGTVVEHRHSDEIADRVEGS
jgi:hypothetical protein